MANTSAFPSLSKICLEKAKALKREGGLEQWCSERGWPVYLHPSTCSDNSPLPCSGLPPVHPKAPLFVFYRPSYLKLFNFGYFFFKILNFKLAGRWEEFPPKTWNYGIVMGLFLWRLSSAQRCKQVNISIQGCMSPGDTSINFNGACILWPKCSTPALDKPWFETAVPHTKLGIN